ncbi:MAG: GNAT family N-acetyltransferase [Gaiellaceae bacterium]
MTDGKVVLRLRDPKDHPLIRAASHDPETQRWLDNEPIPADHVFQDPREIWARGETAPLVIADPMTDRAIGLVSLRVVADGTASLAVSVFPEARVRVVAAAALQLIGRWAMLECGFHRIEAEADIANVASRRTIENAGFMREGILRSHCETHGLRHDCEMFALVRADLS